MCLDNFFFPLLLDTPVVRAVAKEAKYEETFQTYPWTRAYMMAQKNENTIIYSISRTTEREKLFKWIGEIVPANNYLFTLKKRTDIKISKLDDAKKYMVGTVTADAGDMYLISKGFMVGKNIERVPRYTQNIMKVYFGRIDLFWSADLVANFFIKKLGYNPLDFRRAYFLDEISKEGLYMAFSIKTHDDIVAEYKRALEKIKKDGTYSRILRKYLDDL